MVVDQEPLIRLQPGGRAPILSYNLPEPTVYTGRNFIELPYGRDVFAHEGDAGGVDGWRVVLTDLGEDKINLIKVVREITGLGLKEVKDLVESSQPVIQQGVTRATARAAKEQLAEAGATARVIRGRDQTGEALEEESPGPPHEAVVDEVAQAMRSGFADRRVFPAVHIGSGSLRLVDDGADGPAQLVSTLDASTQLTKLDVEEIASRKERGQELSLYTSMSGQVRYRFVARQQAARPRILLVETHRLATYLGAYGAGPVIQTFSLLPGEKTTIDIRTYRKTEEERAETSSILDSFTEESATDFEQTVASEQSDRASYEESFSYHAEAEAKASWGWGTGFEASVSGGVKGGTNAAREQAAKNTTSATDKHAQKASAKRQVEVNTSHERRETTEEERTTAREIENVNVSRTLNFVFRQMNQQFISVLSLVDVRVAYFDGSPGSRDEVPLAALDGLLQRHVVEEQRDQVRADVRDALGSIVDHAGEVHRDFIEEREVDGERYLRVQAEKSSTYTDAANDTAIEVPGVILAATQNVMRTDGVIVEALLGVGGALDGYAARLQELEVERREVDVEATRADTIRTELANDAIRDGDAERVELLQDLAVDNHGVPLELAVRPREDAQRDNNERR